MNVSLTILTIFILLVMFGAGQRVLDNLRLTDRQALWIMLAIVVGILIPPIYIGEYFAFSIGGFLIPFALCVYLLVKVGWSRDLLRATIGIVLVAGAVIGIEWLIPAEPETMTIDPNFIFGLVAGLLAYIMGRSRRNAFISAVLRLTIAEVIQFFINQAKGTPTVLGLGVGGAFDAIIISALLAVALAEFIGRAYEKVKPGKEHKAYNFETGTYDSEKNGKLKKEEFVEYADRLINKAMSKLDKALDRDDIPVNNLTTVIGTLYDKRALAKGEMTSNTSISIKMTDEIKELSK